MRGPARPPMLDYKAMADDGSMLNTPPTFAWYIAGLVFKWLQGQGGLRRDGASATAPRPKLLYAAIDAVRLLPQPGRPGLPLAG